MKRISIRMKTTKDTRKECSRRGQVWTLYFQGRTKPHFPVPAIPLEVHRPDTGYKGIVYIDNVTDHDDPIMIKHWDFYNGSGQ